MDRARRHKKILGLIQSRQITSQLELERLLNTSGIETTQATLSRDLRELNLVKTPQGYALAAALNQPQPDENHLRQTVSQFMTDAKAAGNLVVIRTRPGSAHPVALSLDGSGWKDIVGTVAGDDTVLVVTHNAEAARALRKRILALSP